MTRIISSNYLEPPWRRAGLRPLREVLGGQGAVDNDGGRSANPISGRRVPPNHTVLATIRDIAKGAKGKAIQYEWLDLGRVRRRQMLLKPVLEAC